MFSGFAPYSRGEPDGDHVPVVCQTGNVLLVDGSTIGDSTVERVRWEWEAM